MMGKYSHPLLVTAEQAIEISRHSTTLEIERAKDVVDLWRNNPRFPKQPQFDYFCMLTAIYVAGYLQGRREERAKQRQMKGQ